MEEYMKLMMSDDTEALYTFLKRNGMSIFYINFIELAIIYDRQVFLMIIRDTIVTEDNQYELHNFIAITAAKLERWTILTWIIKLGTPKDNSICTHIVKNGNFIMLKWVRKLGYKWDCFTTEAAAQNGHLETLKWLHENGCPWNIQTISSSIIYNKLDCLKYALENGCHISYVMYELALHCGHIRIIEYLQKFTK